MLYLECTELKRQIKVIYMFLMYVCSSSLSGILFSPGPTSHCAWKAGVECWGFIRDFLCHKPSFYEVNPNSLTEDQKDSRSLTSGADTLPCVINGA